eukprot:m.146712 g.146712  ORF g.146712 m.146712 type:complete len:183 (+) comp24326_c0_seq1:160-708(+)
MEKALQYDNTNIQALQTMASIHISLQKPEEALHWLRQSVQLWHKPPSANTNPETEQSKEEEEDDDDYEDIDDDDDIDDKEEKNSQLPAYEFRINTAKLLVELGELETACEILDRLVIEDDQVLQVWYLLGWVHFLMRESEPAMEALSKTQELYQMNEVDNPDLLQHVAQMLELGGAAPQENQ